jgi:beta-galactosidase/beta-glucuronidase
MRELEVENGKFLLNGKPIFLRGYGDDCIFPNTIAPPAEPEEYLRRLSTARDYGFNYARHHSWFPPEEYFEVADELGIMVQPEFPAAYSGIWPRHQRRKVRCRTMGGSHQALPQSPIDRDLVHGQ